MMAGILVTGAGRGIGLELTRQYVDAGDDVIACVRAPESCHELQELAKRGSVQIVQMDLADFDSISAAREQIGDAPIDVLINNAGYVGGAHQKVDDVDIEEWHRTLDINTIAPLLIARAFKPNLVASGNGKLMNVTSQLAASTWPMGGMIIYSTTKAAMSKIGQILAIDWKDEPIISALMHPGWVKTDMGGPNADITAQESARGIRAVIESLKPEDSGKFYKWNGETHPW
jgi:NAD(P)-dependent dehydrogenase (short-subunit alcohol dehydrogenase family)